MKETPKIDTTHPVPIPTEWNNGSIQMATPPAKPLRGRNHERVRLLGKSCPATEKAARKWFCEIQRVDPGKELVSSPQKPTKSSPLTPASKTGSTPKTERYFEYKDNKSSKFWEICVQGSDVTVRFGKIGGTGQTQSKSFNDPALAYAHAEKLIIGKAKKGYHEMSDENLSAGKEGPNRKSGAFEPQMAPAQEHEPARVSEPGKNKFH